MVESLKESERIEAIAAAEAAAAKKLLEKDVKKPLTRIRRSKTVKTSSSLNSNSEKIDVQDIKKAEIIETYDL